MSTSTPRVFAGMSRECAGAKGRRRAANKIKWKEIKWGDGYETLAGRRRAGSVEAAVLGAPQAAGGGEEGNE